MGKSNIYNAKLRLVLFADDVATSESNLDIQNAITLAWCPEPDKSESKFLTFLLCPESEGRDIHYEFLATIRKATVICNSSSGCEMYERGV